MLIGIANSIVRVLIAIMGRPDALINIWDRSIKPLRISDRTPALRRQGIFQ
jgi:hypothetical protein